ncbi:hypothetical protein VCR31J2_1370068 [Vibrio coralliirubri]|uniref:Uncharacterized protein n=1 Tax=Vibrio coralliirubri TaxID=1516159 RepID=A0AA86WQG1_9VIBR|nr:hypothetical protein VCR31J2_1370068 [Vibrio coralliirubri]
MSLWAKSKNRIKQMVASPEDIPSINKLSSYIRGIAIDKKASMTTNNSHPVPKIGR